MSDATVQAGIASGTGSAFGNAPAVFFVPASGRARARAERSEHDAPPPPRPRSWVKVTPRGPMTVQATPWNYV